MQSPVHLLLHCAEEVDDGANDRDDADCFCGKNVQLNNPTHENTSSKSQGHKTAIETQVHLKKYHFPRHNHQWLAVDARYRPETSIKIDIHAREKKAE